MTAGIPTAAAAIAETSRVRRAPGVVLRHDRVRDGWVLLGPERVLVLDDIALEVIRACVEPDVTVGDGIDQLARAFDAPRAEVAGDVLALLIDMRHRGFIQA